MEGKAVHQLVVSLEEAGQRHFGVGVVAAGDNSGDHVQSPYNEYIFVACEEAVQQGVVALEKTTWLRRNGNAMVMGS